MRFIVTDYIVTSCFSLLACLEIWINVLPFGLSWSELSACRRLQGCPTESFKS